ncbi:hypothetical protein D932_03532 [Enterococcus casseliflavus 14-MB-W-14]|nr:hypothetical protein D932_03532 [Enterococcus casseliflavus 14-MB-W-14]
MKTFLIILDERNRYFFASAKKAQIGLFLSKRREPNDWRE